MRALVTGSEGMFGSWLLPAMAEDGINVVPWDIQEGRDIFDADALTEALEDCDAVVHMAAWPHYTTDLSPTEFIRLNIMGTTAVFQAMRAARVKTMVYISSGAIYGFGPGRSLDGWVTPPITEKKMPVSADDWKMVDAYGASKLATEAWLDVACPRGWRITALRINCIEPEHTGALDGAHWGWWCRQQTAADTIISALTPPKTGFRRVNVGEPNPNLNLTEMLRLWVDVER